MKKSLLSCLMIVAMAPIAAFADGHKVCNMRAIQSGAQDALVALASRDYARTAVLIRAILDQSECEPAGSHDHDGGHQATGRILVVNNSHYLNRGAAGGPPGGYLEFGARVEVVSDRVEYDPTYNVRMVLVRVVTNQSGPIDAPAGEEGWAIADYVGY